MAPRLVLVILAAKGLSCAGSPHALNANCVNYVRLVLYSAVCDRNCRARGTASLAEDPTTITAMTSPNCPNRLATSGDIRRETRGSTCLTPDVAIDRSRWGP
jgi:hypothetical protein